MAEQAQNKLGELFVDIGQSGLGTLVKGLNTLSASFLLGKKGAQEFLKPITSLNKNAMNSVIGYDKLNAVTGISVTKLQELSKWAQLNNVDFGMVAGQIQNLQSKILQIQTGQGGQVNGLSLLGIDPRSLNANDPLKALDVIKQRVMSLQDPATAAYALDMLGLSRDLVYVWKQGNDQLDQRLLLSAQDMENLRTQQELWNSLKVSAASALEKILAKQTWLNDLLQKGTEWLNQLGVTATNLDKQPWFPELKDSLKWIWNILKSIVKALGWLHEGAGKLGSWLGGQQVNDDTLTQMSQLQGDPLTRYKIVKKAQKQQEDYINKAKKQAEKQANKQVKNVQQQPVLKQPTMQPMANPLNVSANPEISTAVLTPTQKSSLGSFTLPAAPNRNITVNTQVTQNITAPDPATAADMSGERIKEQQNQLLEYQYLGGL